MDASALTLLESPYAKRMVAVWPQLAHGLEGLQLVLAWSDASGVARPVVQHLARSLLAAGVVGAEGFVDDTAKKYLTAGALGRRRRK